MGSAINYVIQGSGPHLLMFAPGGFRSVISRWTAEGGKREWKEMDALDTLSRHFTCIAYDRRESGPVRRAHRAVELGPVRTRGERAAGPCGRPQRVHPRQLLRRFARGCLRRAPSGGLPRAAIALAGRRLPLDDEGPHVLQAPHRFRARKRPGRRGRAGAEGREFLARPGDRAVGQSGGRLPGFRAGNRKAGTWSAISRWSR